MHADATQQVVICMGTYYDIMNWVWLQNSHDMLLPLQNPRSATGFSSEEGRVVYYLYSDTCKRTVIVTMVRTFLARLWNCIRLGL